MCIHKTEYYREGPCDIDYECPDFEKLSTQVHEAKEFFEDLIKDFYALSPINEGDFEWRVEEICDRLGLKFPVGKQLNLMRKQ